MEVVKLNLKTESTKSWQPWWRAYNPKKQREGKDYPKPGNGADEKKEELDAIQLKFTKKSAVFRLKGWNRWRVKRSENQRDCFQQLADSGILSLHHPCDNVFMLSKRLRFFLDTPTKSQLRVLPLLSLAHRKQPFSFLQLSLARVKSLRKSFTTVILTLTD